MPNEMRVFIEGYDEVKKEIQSMQSKSEKAVNRTVADFKSRGPGWVAQEVVKVYNVSKKDVNETKKGIRNRGTVKVKGVKLDNLSLVYSGRRLTLTHFGMTPKKPPELTDKIVRINIPGVGFRNVRTRKKVKVKATIFRGHQKVMTGEYDTPVYIQTNPKKAGQYLPFQRTGNIVKETGKDERVSIKSLSIPQMITNEGVEQTIHKRIDTELIKRLEHHLKRAMK